MIITFLTSAFGSYLITRILPEVFTKLFLLEHQAVTLRRTIFAVLVALTFLNWSSPIKHWLFIGILILSLKFFPKLFNFFSETKFQKQIIPILDALILEMKLGKSFQYSLKLVSQRHDGWVGLQLKMLSEKIENSIYTVDRKFLSVAAFEEMMFAIDRSNSRNIERVVACRNHYKMFQNFRRRSGQITAQIKMQAIIVTFLFLGLLGFVIAQFGYRDHLSTIVAASFFFVIGLVSIFFIGRRMKWKV